MMYANYKIMEKCIIQKTFKGIKSLGSKGIKGDIKPGRYNYFEFDFKIGDIPSEETREILRAFRKKFKVF